MYREKLSKEKERGGAPGSEVHIPSEVSSMEANHTAVAGSKARRPYSRLAFVPVHCEVRDRILAASVVDNSVIESIGQELGPTYDFSEDTDSLTGKEFSHEWGAGE